MNLEKFTGGSEFTLGAELELRVLNKKSLEHENRFYYISENMPKKYQNFLASEFLASMVEINTPVCNTASEVRSFFEECVNEMVKVASQKDLLLSTSGTYALENKHLTINGNKRYESFFDEYQILLKDFNICGFHVHVGFENFDQALKAL